MDVTCDGYAIVFFHVQILLETTVPHASRKKKERKSHTIFKATCKAISYIILIGRLYECASELLGAG
jgi:hypothetical protein